MKRILIWGTGNIAKEVMSNGISGEIIGFIQTNKTSQVFMDKCVYSIEEIPEDPLPARFMTFAREEIFL